MSYDPKAFRLDGAVAVVTGAGAGIGKAIATTFGGAGAAVVVSHLDGKAAETTWGVLLRELLHRVPPHVRGVSERDPEGCPQAALSVAAKPPANVPGRSPCGEQPKPAAVPQRSRQLAIGSTGALPNRQVGNQSRPGLNEPPPKGAE
jgi:NAD(P)-dependent dehydrogenase (short-subunit alcohol dehydrogenase family)